MRYEIAFQLRGENPEGAYRIDGRGCKEKEWRGRWGKSIEECGVQVGEERAGEVHGGVTKW